MKNYSRSRSFDAGKALAIRLDRIRQDSRFLAGIEAMKARCEEIFNDAPALDSEDFYFYALSFGGFSALEDAFKEVVGDAVEAGVVEGALWGAIRLDAALVGDEWLNFKNAAINARS